VRENRLLGVLLCAGATVFAACAAASPQIDYRAESNVIWVTGYPEDAPATMDDVVTADRQGRWGKTSYEPVSDTYTLGASLWIGTDQDAGTFFQIGRTNHPRETLVMAGDLWVRPAKPTSARVANTIKAAYIVNRLTLGDERNSAIRPLIKFACSKMDEFGLMAGVRNGGAGDLSLFNAAITAATPGKDHTWRGYPGGWWCAHLHIRNSVVSWVGSELVLGAVTLYRGLKDSNMTVDGLTIEDAEGVRIVAVFPQAYLISTVPDTIPLCFIRNSTFRRAGAVAAPHATTFIHCFFEGNRQNMAFTTMPAAKIAMLDCEVKPQTEPFTMPKVKPTPQQVASGKLPKDCCLYDVRTVVCHVQDRKGRPIPYAMVDVACAQDATAVHRRAAVTDSQGNTPSDIERGAAFADARRTFPGDDPAKPVATTFRHTLTVRAVGYKTYTQPLDLSVPAARPLAITLQRE
jgi:hypothetical protein